MSLPKAHVSVSDFGTRAQLEELNTHLKAHIFDGYINDNCVLVISMKAYELGAFFEKVANDPKLNWIEYTVQLEN